mgnify:CR=1 FL=1
MSPRTGRPTENPKMQRLEIRLTNEENERIQTLVEHFGTNKTEVLMRGLVLVELQVENKDFQELSNALIIRELQNKSDLSREDKEKILHYLELLAKKYR